MLKPAIDPHAHARNTDPKTSHASARRMSDHISIMRKLLKAHNDNGPLTRAEAAEIVGWEEYAVSKRLSDLVNQGLLESNGLTRPGPSGREQLVRHITVKGIRELTS